MTNPKQALPERTRSVLFAAIAEYVATGRPVSSRALAKKLRLDLSPATIRRELHELTERAFLVQPHTSAGRVPSDGAFRLFAETLRREATRIDGERRERWLSRLSETSASGQRPWQAVARLLADLSFQAALIVTPSLRETVLKQIRFVSLGATSLLAVVITREGIVHNAFLEAPEPLSDRDLERIHNYLSGLVEGRTLDDIRRLLRAELEDARARCDALRERATLLCSRAIEPRADEAPELVVDGRRHLLTQPELKDRLDELMGVLEEKTRVLELLDRAAARDQGPMVIIGTEGGEGFEGCALIGAQFDRHGGTGRIGVVGSARMDYTAVIPLVSIAAEYLSGGRGQDGGLPG